MKKIYVLVFLIFNTLTTFAALHTFTATLNGDQVTFPLPNPTVTATGTFSGTYDDVAHKFINYTLTFTGLSSGVTAAHFHGDAAPGAGAGVKLGIGAGTIPSPYSEVNVPVSLANEPGLLAGLWYVNIHTVNFGGGEIRGQVTQPPLAVELKDFTAIKKENNIQLQWKTLSEKNNKGFHVERSVDGENYDVIGFVAGKNNSTVSITYDFMDKNPAKSNYYRLRQQNFDGKESMSKVVNQIINGNHKMTLGPNPVKDNLMIYFEDNTSARLLIYDMVGRLVLTKTLQSNITHLDVSNYQAGNYLLQIIANNQSYSQLLVKN
jgi:CHRD domain/Secretion system C-terminal sorting domain